MLLLTLFDPPWYPLDTTFKQSATLNGVFSFFFYLPSPRPIALRESVSTVYKHQQRDKPKKKIFSHIAI
jgi:hypothetical protein